MKTHKFLFAMMLPLLLVMVPSHGKAAPLQLTDDQPRENYTFLWPDGSKLLYCKALNGNRRDIFTVPISGTMTETLLSPGSEYYSHPHVNPAGTHITYSYGPTAQSYWEVAVLPLSGSQTIITNNGVNNLDSWQPRYKPSGDKIAYVRRDHNGFKDELVLIDIDGSNEVVICELNGVSEMVQAISWLGDSDELLFSGGGDFGGTGGLYRVAATAGATPVQIGSDTDYNICRSNSDGTEIVANIDVGGGEKNWVIVDAATGAREVIVNLDEFPEFSWLYGMCVFDAQDEGVIGSAVSAVSGNADLYYVTELCNIESSSLGYIKSQYH